MELKMENFFKENLSDEKKGELETKVQAMIAKLEAAFAANPPPKGVAFITSGGTAVPLEVNAVRYLTNFSSGGRGAYLVESLVERGWACVSLRSHDAVVPFRRVLTSLETGELFAAVTKGTAVQSTSQKELTTMSDLYDKSRSLVADVIFKDVVEYLFLLKEISLALCQSSRPYSHASLIFFAAAAVSDYYIPQEKMSREKISGGDGLTLHFENVPKVLGLLQEKWLCREDGLPKPFTVTFKLETSEEAMHSKALKNLNAYRCNAVVANLLQSYKERVWVYLLDEIGKEPFLVTKGDCTIESALCDHFLSNIE